MEYTPKKLKEYYEHTLLNKPFLKARGLIIDDDKLIVIGEKQPNGEVWYYLAGGGIEDGETPKQAVVREIMEETNINSSVVTLLHTSHERVKFSQDGYNIDCKRNQYFYICNYVNGEPKPEQSEVFIKKNRFIARIPFSDIDKIKTSKYFLAKAKDYIDAISLTK